MPLLSNLPSIDDRTWADIVAEARTRIPRYTPEWTDTNSNDPGMTLIELFAWLTEMQLFRLGRVPQLNYVKFLELVGLELNPARPARVEVTLPLSSGSSEASVLVPRRTQIATSEPDDEGPIIFETDESLVALRAGLRAVQVFDGYSYSDVTLDNEEASAGFAPFGPLAEEGSALLLGLDGSSPLAAVEIQLALWTVAGAVPGPVSGCYPATPTFAEGEIRWEYWDGAEWIGLAVRRDDTVGFARSGHLVLAPLPADMLTPSVLGAVADPHYWIRARLTRSDYQVPPTLSAIRTNTVRATQAQTVRDEIVGGSTGREEQTFTLENAPVLADTLRLEVDEGDGFVGWTEVADFFGSGPDDTHFVLDRATGQIRFGDGDAGRIPTANPASPGANVVAREYRFGGGRRGNVAAGTMDSLLSSVRGIDSGAVSNLFAAAGGSDEETLDAARTRAPQALKARERAVTPGDFEMLALSAANIARARALPLHHPAFPGVEVPGVMSVIVVPDLDGDPAPMPTEGTLRAVCAHLDQRRLLTTELYVLPPTYVDVTVAADLVVRADYDLLAVQGAVTAALERWFHPLTGGDAATETTDGPGWPFGGHIYWGQLVHRLMGDGVLRVASAVVTLNGKDQPACADVRMPEGVLLRSGAHHLQVRYDDEGWT